MSRRGKPRFDFHDSAEKTKFSRVIEVLEKKEGARLDNFFTEARSRHMAKRLGVVVVVEKQAYFPELIVA
ncbi:MAG: hypothetical protein PHE24_01100 [Patescibacteria group bacterium]|nr:hypothetical protein [Patescibacteria group bacterium]